MLRSDFPARIGPYRVTEPLGKGGMAVLYRAEHVDSGQVAVVKTVRSLDEELLAGLRREIHALARVRHPGIVRILEQGVDVGRPWYAMELLAGVTLGRYAARRRPRSPAAASTWGNAPTRSPQTREADRTWSTRMLGDGPRGAAASPDQAPSRSPAVPAPDPEAGAGDWLREALTLVGKLCATLSFVHGEGLVHRDLKPDNILIVEGCPMLVDFGLACQFFGALSREALEVGGLLVGTAPYMAPEQIRGDFVDARADLYSLGCILYELATGQRPFAAFSTQALLRMHLEQQAAPPSSVAAGIPAALDELILRLLAKAPSARLGYADDVRAALARIGVDLGSATAHADALPAPRPYLYRPGFSGRASTLGHLRGHLDQLDAGRGGVVAIGGQSGVGKTRLVMELAREAAPRRVSVLTGECPDAAARALEGMRQPLRQIADRCLGRGDTEIARVLGPRAKILAPYQPALNELPGVDAMPAPAALSGDAARQRVFESLLATLAALAASTPVLVVIDDIQWADGMTLDFLRFLLRTSELDRTALLVVATYRSEEVGDDLQALLDTAGVRSVPLSRLDDEAVGAMVGDMLALSPPPAAFCEFVAAQSEGNPFFAAEYLRAAVDQQLLTRNQAGQWQAVMVGGPTDLEAATSPLSLPASLEELVSRRLHDLSDTANALAGAAAVAGREAGLELVARTSALPEVAVFEGVHELVRRQVVEAPEGGRIRFSHDKIREVAYARLDPGRRAALHRAAATGLEALAAGRLPNAQLAHHWQRAGAGATAVHYLDRAGTEALAGGAYRQAARHFRDALELDRELGEGDPLRRARRERQLAEAVLGLGNHTAGQQSLLRSLAAMGESTPASTTRLFFALLGQVAQQLGHRLLPVAASGAARPRAELLEVSRTYQRLMETCWFANHVPRLVDSALRALNIAERAGPSAELARAYASMCIAAGSIPIHSLAEGYARRALAIGKQVDSPSDLAYVLFLTNVYRIGTGAWEKVDRELEQCAAICRETGDTRFLGESWTTLGMAALYQGAFAQARTRFALVRDAGRRTGNWQHQLWGAIGEAEAHIRLGDPETGRAALQNALGLLRDRPDPPEELRARGLLAVLHWGRGERDRASAEADRAAALMAGLKVPTAHYLLEGYAGVAEIRIEQWAEMARAAASVPGAINREANRACAALRAFARIFPIGRPRAALWTARALWLAGRHGRARRAWAAAANAAKALRMPQESARVAATRTRHLPSAEAEETALQS